MSSRNNSRNILYKKQLVKKKMMSLIFYGMIFVIATIAFFFLNASSAQNVLDLAVCVKDENSEIEELKYEIKVPQTTIKGNEDEEDKEIYITNFSSLQGGFIAEKFVIVSEEEFKLYGNDAKIEAYLNKQKAENDENVEDNETESEDKKTEEVKDNENKVEENNKEEKNNTENTTEEKNNTENKETENKVEENTNTNDENTEKTTENTEDSAEAEMEKIEKEREKKIAIEEFNKKMIEEATEVHPGEEIEIKGNLLESQKIYLIAKYETKTQNNKVLYNKKISSKNDKNTIIVSGFMPKDAELRINEVKKEDIEGKIKEKADKDVTLSVAYDIKILYEGKEYEPTDFDETTEVRILGLENETINVWHIKNDNSVEVMDTVRNGKSVTFDTPQFSVYGIEVLETPDQESAIKEEKEIENTTEEKIVEEESDITPSTPNKAAPKKAPRRAPSSSEGDSTLTINDYESDKNYYLGKNFTDNVNLEGADSGTYTTGNLIKVTIKYHGFAQGTTDSLMKGRISLTERQDIIEHIRCYPKGNIAIELMDNPFMDMPLGYSNTEGDPDTGYGFGGWNNPSTGSITSGLAKIQTLNISASSDITVNVYANWVQANVVYLNPGEGYDTLDGVNNNGETPETPVGSWGRAFTVLNSISGNKTDRERNIIVLTGNIGMGINYSRTVTGTSTTYADVNYSSSTTFTSGGTYIISTGTGAGGTALTASGNSDITNSTLSNTQTPALTAQWVIQQVSGGYTIRNASTGRYLTYDDYYGLEQSTSSQTWTYSNGRLSCSVSDYWSGTTTYYLRYRNGWTATDRSNNASQINFITYTTTNERTEINTTTSNNYGTTNYTGNVAVTVTSMYGHVDYRENATMTLNSNYGNFVLGQDFQMHHVRISATGYTSNSEGTGFSTSYPWLRGQLHNVRLGRGIIVANTGDDGATFANVIGAGQTNNTTNGSTTSSNRAYKVVVESGKYSSIVGHNYSTRNNTQTNTYYGTIYLTVGSDIDRANNVNTNLSVYNRTTIICGYGYVGQSNIRDKAFLIDVKSGTLGYDYFNAGGKGTGNSAYAGIYVGGFGYLENYYDYSDRYCIIEGGSVANIIGGLRSVTSRKVQTRIYVKGGEVLNIVGGAGVSTTYNDRMIQVTGGTVRYSVAGGSNGVAANSASDNGKLDGKTLIYIGGNAQIGTDSTVEKTLYGTPGGSVLGAGNGTDNEEYNGTSGQVNSSKVIINGSAHILNSVYGGGNYGVVGSNSTDGSTQIEILGGTIDQNVYGGANKNNIYGTTTINVKGGQVKGAVYGGSNEKGTITRTTTVNVTGGTLGETTNTTADQVLFGGGYGANTTVTGNATVNILDTSGNVNIYGSAYGGSSLGTMSANTVVTIQDLPSETGKINIVGNVFAGGKGDESNSATVTGNSTLTVDGANLPNASVFGGNDINGVTNGNITVNIGQNYESKVGNVYGGGNEDDTGTEADTVKVNLLSHADVTNAFNGGKSADLITGGNTDTTRAIYLQGGKATNIFGGSDSSGTVTASHVYIQSGTATNVYGGNNLGGQTTTSFVYVTGGTSTNVFGGGYQATTPTTNVSLTGGTVTNGFGGGNAANVTTANITLAGTSATNIYGGSNSSGTVTTSNVNIQSGTTTNTFGGNNAGGRTVTSNVNVTGGRSTNVYGGNNQNGTTGTSNVNVTGGTVTDVFGGNNLGGSTGDTNVIVTTSIRNVYGGGNHADTSGNTNVYLKSATITGSAFGGGNGTINRTEATVNGNSTIKVEGTTRINGDLFGGGNAAANGVTGGNSLVTVLVTGGTIVGDLYGAANTSVVNGSTVVKIGETAVNDNTMVTGPINIGGTVFGGGKSNAAGSDSYDFSFESVTGDANILIYATGYSNNDFVIGKSIFGSGNAAMISGDGNVTIKDYGTLTNIKDNVSIQRAAKVVLDNCNIHLTGTTDTTNEIATAIYTFNRIDDLVLKNNTTLYLDNGVNITAKLESVTSTDAKAAVSISSTGVTSRNVDNRIYVRQGKNIILRTEDKSNGEVHGMTYFGIYIIDDNTHARTFGIYDRSHTHGENVSADLYKIFSRNSYVQGQHYPSHDIEVDGFYTNYYDGLEESTSANIKTAYIIPTPESANYYQWIAGKATSDIYYDDIELISTKYATTAAYVLYLDGLNYPNMKVEVKDFEITNLKEGITLKNPNDIPNIADVPEGISYENHNMNLAPANTEFGLTMTAGNTGWQTRGHADFMTSPNSTLVVPDNPDDPDSPTTTYKYGSFNGTTLYTSDNSNTTPTFSFYMEHSKNISHTAELGTVTVHLEATYTDENTQEAIIKNAYVVIKLSINNMVDIDNDYYEGAITPGKEYSMFPTTATNITKRSSFSAYYSLFVNNFSRTYYDRLEGLYYHALSSSVVLPANTKITLIDMSGDTEKYYYYIVSQADATGNKKKYRFSDFKAMDSEQEPYSSDGIYYNSSQDLVYEEFIVQVDFEDATINANMVSQSLVVELIDIGDDTVTLTVNTSQYPMKFSVYNNLEANSTIDLTTNKTVMYMGDQLDMHLVNTFALSKTPNGDDVFDTSHLSDQLGVRFTLSLGSDKLTSENLTGIYIRYNNQNYFARADGTFRIKIADVVANVLADMELHTENGDLASGTYTIKAESFGSYDGTYFADTIAYDQAEVQIVNSNYGLVVDLNENSYLIDKATGKGKDNSNQLNFSIGYSGAFANPKLTVKLYRRTYDAPYVYTYNLVDLATYTTTTLTSTDIEKEYLVTNSVQATQNFPIVLKENLTTGTYKFVFSLYDGTRYIAEMEKMIIVK